MQPYLVMLFCCLPLGLVSGFMAGLFGIGGGIITVPGLLLLFDWMQFDEASNYHLAVGTSLCAIIFSSLLAVYRHQQYLKLDIPVIRLLVPGVVAGFLVAAYFFADLPRTILQLGFVVFLGCVLLRLLAVPQHKNAATTRMKNSYPSRLGLKRRVGLCIGFLAGFIAPLLGIGGGTMIIPLLDRYAIPMPHILAVASFIGMVIALFSTVNSIYVGGHHANLPVYSLGYVYWPAALGISLTSFLTVPAGVYYAHHLDQTVLKRLFAGLLVLIILNMLIRH